MKTIAVVGTVGIPACYGGFESLVENLTINKSDDHKYIVFCSANNYKTLKETHNDAELIYLHLKANGIQSILYDIASLVKCWSLKPDVVLILGVSGCLFLPIFRFFSSSKVVTNIDGLEWKRDKWNKYVKFFLKLSEKAAVKYSDIIVTDNQAIGEYVEFEYGCNSTTIAYGGDHALRDIDVKLSINEESYALGLCRIEPENNVKMILEAFAQSEMKLKFVGNWDSSEFGRALKEMYQHKENIELIGPIYDLDELYVLRKCCSLYLHGHSAGGTNPSLVEMMHFKVPIYAFDCNFNRYSTEGKASYFDSVQSLVNLLRTELNVSKLDNACAMQDIARDRYTWKEISKAYKKTY